MARLRNGIDFTGRLGDLTAYRMKGSDDIFLRRIGGPSAHQIKNDPKFKTVRLNGKEFGGRAKATALFAKMLHPHKTLSDHNYLGTVSSRMKRLQDLDTEHPLGQRNILFSRYPDLWEGLSLNRKRSFDSLVLAPLECAISRDTWSARIEIPNLIPDVHLRAPVTQSLFRIQAALGILPDVMYQNARKGYIPAVPKDRIAPVQETTLWMSCRSTSAATALELKLPHVDIDGGFALMVSIGICFGVPITRDGIKIQQADQAGAAKVMRVE